MSILTGLIHILILIFGVGAGLSMGLLIAPESVIEIEVPIITEKLVLVDNPIVTEKIVTIEIEKPIVTQQIVEVLKEVEVYRFIDEDNPVHKWIDPDNQAVVYIYPEGYTGQVMPLYALVPPIWFEQILQFILAANNGVLPPEIINSIPKEWMEAVAPGTINVKKTGSFN